MKKRILMGSLSGLNFAKQTVMIDCSRLTSANCVQFITKNKCVFLKGTMARFVHLEKFSLNISNSSFAIRVNLLHP